MARTGLPIGAGERVQVLPTIGQAGTGSFAPERAAGPETEPGTRRDPHGQPMPHPMADMSENRASSRKPVVARFRLTYTGRASETVTPMEPGPEMH